MFRAQLSQDSCGPAVRSGTWETHGTLSTPGISTRARCPTASHAVPGTPNKWLICSRNELFFFSDGFLCLGRTSLSAEPGAVAVGVGELEGGFHGVCPAAPTSSLQGRHYQESLGSLRTILRPWRALGPRDGGPPDWPHCPDQSSPNACQPWPHVTPASLRPWFSSLRISRRGQPPDGLPGLPRTRTTHPRVPPLGSFPPPPIQHWHPEPTCSFPQSAWEGHP